jgi:hypothetical protein
MMHLYDRATMAHALSLDLDPKLRALLASRIEALGEELIEWTEFLVVEAGDTEADVVRHVGFSPLVEPFDGLRFGNPEFQPHWDWLVDHGGWFELCRTYGSAFAYMLFIRDTDDSPAGLRALCKMFATEA